MLSIRQLKGANEKTLQEMQGLLAQLSPTLGSLEQKRLMETTENPQGAVFVVREHGKIVGTASVLFCRSLSGGLHGFVEDVVVDEKARGKGIGKALMEKLIATATKRGAHHLNLTSRAERDVANHLYQTLGFRKRETNMYRLSLV